VFATKGQYTATDMANLPRVAAPAILLRGKAGVK